jgi:hypothetical protein
MSTSCFSLHRSPGAKPESIAQLLALTSPYHVQLAGCSNVPLGKGGFYAPSNGLPIQPFLLGPLKRTATSFQCYKHKDQLDSDEAQQTKTLLFQLCDYLLEQGWNEGNGNIEGHLDIGKTLRTTRLVASRCLGYEIRNFPMCLVYIRDTLKENNRLHAMISSAAWIMSGHLLLEEKPSSMSTDVIHNYLVLLVGNSVAVETVVTKPIVRLGSIDSVLS